MQGVFKLPSGGFEVRQRASPPSFPDTGSQQAGLWRLAKRRGKMQTWAVGCSDKPSPWRQI